MKAFRLVYLPKAIVLLVLATGAVSQQSGSTPQASSAPAQADKPAVQAPFLRSTTNLVIVDVVVSHDGHPVKGLQQQAFHLFEDGHEQAIKSFEEHSPADATRPETVTKLPANTYSNVPEASEGAINVLLLDAVNTPVSDQAYARHKIIEYLKTIPPGTRMAVFTLASRLRMVQGFTTDSSVLLAALSKSWPTGSIALTGNRGESEADRLQALGVGQNPFGQGGMQQTSIDSVIASLHQFEADEEANLLDRRVQITLDAMRQLAVYLGAIPGRKNVIWFSASFPLSLGPDTPLDPLKALRSYGPQLQQISDLLTTSRIAVYPIDARGLITTMPATQTRPAAVAIGSGRTGMIDPNAFPADPSQTQDRNNAEFATMLQLADQTGGIPFYNSNALKQALAKAVENGSSYYTLAYSPEDKRFDGRYRKIQVKIAGHDHPAYRHGYFADPPVVHNANALLNMSTPALQPDAPSSSQVLFRARLLASGDPAAQDLQPAPGPAGDLATKLKPPVKRYWIEYTANMNQVNAEADANGLYRSTIEFIAIAYDHNGSVVNAARHSYKLGMPQARYDDVMKNGFTIRNEIDLPEGPIWLRLAVHDVSGDRVGSIEVPLVVAAKTSE